LERSGRRLAAGAYIARSYLELIHGSIIRFDVRVLREALTALSDSQIKPPALPEVLTSFL
jgi:hypothetical protein